MLARAGPFCFLGFFHFLTHKCLAFSTEWSCVGVDYFNRPGLEVIFFSYIFLKVAILIFTKNRKTQMPSSGVLWLLKKYVRFITLL